jgi:hypothetical protein
MSALVFLDTETTGLGLDDDIWEFAAIRREPDGSESTMQTFIDHDETLAADLPEPFHGDYLQRFDRVWSLSQSLFADVLDELFRDRPHVIGAVPSFDTERLARLLTRYGYRPSWHYHLIDVETLAVGYLAGKGEPLPELPWDSNELSRRVGVEPPEDRHTALGDATWTRDIYDAITRQP